MTISSMRFPEKIESENVVLRRPEPADAKEIFEEYASDPEVTRYLTWRPCSVIDEVSSYLAEQHDSWESGQEYSWVITIAGKGNVVGMLTAANGAHGLSIGYVVGKKHWNRGYMTEALSVLVDCAFKNPDVHRIWATCDVENRGSVRVLEKCGFFNEGLLRRWVIHPNVSSKPRDNIVFALTK
jgi:RimJ/RimL family protein N-acetyltransferase